MILIHRNIQVATIAIHYIQLRRDIWGLAWTKWPEFSVPYIKGYNIGSKRMIQEFPKLEFTMILTDKALQALIRRLLKCVYYGHIQTHALHILSQQIFALLKTSWQHLKDVFHIRFHITFWRRLQDVLIKTTTEIFVWPETFKASSYVSIENTYPRNKNGRNNL